MADKLERITGDASIKKYFDTDYLGAYSIDEGVEPIVTIEGIWHGDLTLGGGRKEHHVLLKFKEKSVRGIEEVKPLILNATNRKTLKKVYGDDSAKALEDKKIQLYIDPKVRDPQDGGFTEGLRIRPFKPKESAPTAQSAPIPPCADCREEIRDFIDGNGKTVSAKRIYEASLSKYGEGLCSSCAAKAAIAASAEAEGTENAE